MTGGGCAWAFAAPVHVGKSLALRAVPVARGRRCGTQQSAPRKRAVLLASADIGHHERQPPAHSGRREFITACLASLVGASVVRSSAVEAAMYRTDTKAKYVSPQNAKLSAIMPQIRDGYTVLVDLRDTWDAQTAALDGDVVRRVLGTVGVTSPLFGIRKTFLRAWSIVAESGVVEEEVIDRMETDWNDVLDGISSVDYQVYSVGYTELLETKLNLLRSGKMALDKTIIAYKNFRKLPRVVTQTSDVCSFDLCSAVGITLMRVLIRVAMYRNVACANSGRYSRRAALVSRCWNDSSQHKKVGSRQARGRVLELAQDSPAGENMRLIGFESNDFRVRLAAIAHMGQSQIRGLIAGHKGLFLAEACVIAALDPVSRCECVSENSLCGQKVLVRARAEVRYASREADDGVVLNDRALKRRLGDAQHVEHLLDNILVRHRNVLVGVVEVCFDDGIGFLTELVVYGVQVEVSPACAR